MLNSYKDYNKIIIFFAIFCFLAGLLGVELGMVIKDNYVYADYVDDIVNNPQAIVNFNQLFDNTLLRTSPYYNIALSKVDSGTYHIEGTNTNWDAFIGFNGTSENINLTAGHKYYVRSNVTQSSVDVQLGRIDQTIYLNLARNNDAIYTPDSNISCLFGFKIWVNIVYNFNVQPTLIDLTAMFGENNIPSLNECRNIFTADYYAYNTGTPMTYNTIDAYNNGVNAYLGSQEYTISSLGFINSVYPVVLNNEYGLEESLVTRNTSQNYVQVDSGSAYTDPTLCLPFNYTIPAGTQITIKGACSTTQYHASYRMYVGFWGNGGEMISVPESMIAGTQGNFRSSTITFTLPMSVDRIYLIVTDDATWRLKDFEVGYYLTNADVLRELGYKDGVAYMEKLYAPTGAYYQAIYQSGYNAGHDAPTYTFKDLIVASVDTPIQAFTSLFDFDILGVNMKTFYLSIFTMCVIFVVLKLVL